MQLQDEILYCISRGMTWAFLGGLTLNQFAVAHGSVRRADARNKLADVSGLAAVVGSLMGGEMLKSHMEALMVEAGLATAPGAVLGNVAELPDSF